MTAAAAAAAAAATSGNVDQQDATDTAPAAEEEAVGAASVKGSADLPYPQLSQTVSSANFAPAAHLAEHYSPLGGVFFIMLPVLAMHQNVTSML